MWTRGRDKEQPGAFAYELWDDCQLIERRGGFATAQEADRAAEAAQRRQIFGAPVEPLEPDLAAMSTDELLAALTAP